MPSAMAKRRLRLSFASPSMAERTVSWAVRASLERTTVRLVRKPRTRYTGLGMVAPRFTVQVKDLDYGDRDLDEEIPVEWLAQAFEGTEATPTNRCGHLTATLS